MITELDSAVFEETDKFDVFVYRGAELFICTSDGRRVFCKPGDQVTVSENAEGWCQIEDITPALLH
jgi:hypothetical protein